MQHRKRQGAFSFVLRLFQKSKKFSVRSMQVEPLEGRFLLDVGLFPSLDPGELEQVVQQLPGDSQLDHDLALQLSNMSNLSQVESHPREDTAPLTRWEQIRQRRELLRQRRGRRSQLRSTDDLLPRVERSSLDDQGQRTSSQLTGDLTGQLTGDDLDDQLTDQHTGQLTSSLTGELDESRDDSISGTMDSQITGSLSSSDADDSRSTATTTGRVRRWSESERRRFWRQENESLQRLARLVDEAFSQQGERDLDFYEVIARRLSRFFR